MTNFAACSPDSGSPRRLEMVRRLVSELARRSRALVAPPRNHGRGGRVCPRLLWDLGRDPSLRIKIVCATEALAVERARFLRDAIRANARLRLVFPHLRPARPWE